MAISELIIKNRENKVNKYLLTDPLKLTFCQAKYDICKMLAQKNLFWDLVLAMA